MNIELKPLVPKRVLARLGIRLSYCAGQQNDFLPAKVTASKCGNITVEWDNGRYAKHSIDRFEFALVDDKLNYVPVSLIFIREPEQWLITPSDGSKIEVLSFDYVDGGDMKLHHHELPYVKIVGNFTIKKL